MRPKKKTRPLDVISTPEGVHKVMRALQNPSLPPSRREFLVKTLGAWVAADAAVYLSPDAAQGVGRRLFRPFIPDPNPTPPDIPGCEPSCGGGTLPEDKTILTFGDLKLIGFKALMTTGYPSGVQAPGLNMGSATAHRVMADGTIRWFFIGNSESSPQHPLLEFIDDPMIAPNPSKATPTRIPLHKNYGAFGPAITSNPLGINWDNSLGNLEKSHTALWYDHAKELLWYAWRQNYNRDTLTCSTLAFGVDPVTKDIRCQTIATTGVDALTMYGNSWKTTLKPKDSVDWFTLPEWFRGFVNGANVGCHGTMHSIISAAAYGCSLSTRNMGGSWDPFTTPADFGTAAKSVELLNVRYPDEAHPQSLDAGPFRKCGWYGGSADITYGGVEYLGYDCAAPRSTTVPPYAPLDEASGRTFLNTVDTYSNPAARNWKMQPSTGSSPLAEQNSVTAAVWIDLPDKHGLFYFGRVVGSPPGYSAPGDPDGCSHVWYGPLTHGSMNRPTGIDNRDLTVAGLYGATDVGYENNHCCHGQDTPPVQTTWQGTGDGSHWQLSMGWIYDPIDLALVANGDILDEHSVVPTSDSVKLQSGPWSWLNFRKGPNQVLPGAYVDPVNRILKIWIHSEDGNRPIMAVFSIA